MRERNRLLQISKLTRIRPFASVHILKLCNAIQMTSRGMLSALPLHTHNLNHNQMTATACTSHVFRYNQLIIIIYTLQKLTAVS